MLVYFIVNRNAFYLCCLMTLTKYCDKCFYLILNNLKNRLAMPKEIFSDNIVFNPLELCVNLYIYIL